MVADRAWRQALAEPAVAGCTYAELWEQSPPASHADPRTRPCRTSSVAAHTVPIRPRPSTDSNRYLPPQHRGLLPVRCSRVLRDHPGPVLRRERPAHRLRRRIDRPRIIARTLRPTQRTERCCSSNCLLSRPTRCTRPCRMSHLIVTGRGRRAPRSGDRRLRCPPVVGMPGRSLVHTPYCGH